MGERRLRAAVAAGLTRIPAIVRETADDAMLRDALLENMHRASSTRWRKRRPTSSCSRTSGSRTRNWLSGSAGAGRR